MRTEDSSNTDVDDLLINTRAELALFCRSARTRTSVYGELAGTPWSPQTVIDPDTDRPYTVESAWQRIAAELESGCPLEIDQMERSDTEPEYVMRWHHGGGHEVVVRLQRGATKIIGRSFCYTKTSTTDGRP